MGTSASASMQPYCTETALTLSGGNVKLSPGTHGTLQIPLSVLMT